MSASLAPQLESHEERLQRVENNSEETRIRVAEIVTKMDFQKISLDQTRADLATKIDQGFERMVSEQEKILSRLDLHSKKLDDHTERLETVEKDRATAAKKKTEQKNTIKKILIGALLAGAGVFGTKLAESFWASLGK